MNLNYDVIVIGAGHAGCEAAHAAAQLGAATLLITMDMNKIAQMSCNPAVGGIAKGQIVREIDALGGMMGRVADRTAIQRRMLNRSKGAAMWSPRAQCDRTRFITTWRHVLDRTPNLFIWQDVVMELLTEPSIGTAPSVSGVKTQLGLEFKAPAVVITAGTFLNGLMHIGRTKIPGGRVAEAPSLRLSESIARHGIRVGRMKTGTPVRIDGRSVDFSQMVVQPGDNDYHRFSYFDPEAHEERLQQLPCWAVYTNPAVHERLRASLPDSPLYNGQIQSVGPRYCPSIETKLVTFADRDQHLLYLEPEGADTQEYYLNGFSSSMPIQAQVEALRLIPAFRNVRIYRPGYAIEYDYFDPTQLHPSLESRLVGGLFLAGQVNGTTGYEEAAAQGLVAGIAAAGKASGVTKLPNLTRQNSYIGVLIDDLITKGVDEPYRMFTSRSEYRILLRQDNADHRLTPEGEAAGLVQPDRRLHHQAKERDIAKIAHFTATHSVRIRDINPYLEQQGIETLRRGCKLATLLERPGITINAMKEVIPELAEALATLETSPDEVAETVEADIKYSGYTAQTQLDIARSQTYADLPLRGRYDYASIEALSNEAREKLQRHDPATLGEASRIPGVTPADINVLLVLHRK